MNNYSIRFIDVIPDFATQLGISNLGYMHVAVRQAEYYGFNELAEWLQTVEDRLKRAIEEEWNAEPFDNATDSNTW
jgi:hypothetical protein